MFEGWDIGKKGFGGGTVNHAWSGGPLTVIAQYLCGVAPLLPGYRLFKIEPEPASFKKASITVPTVAGIIKSDFCVDPGVFTLRITVPFNTKAIVYLPVKPGTKIFINGKILSGNAYRAGADLKKEGKQAYLFAAGDYTIIEHNSPPKP